jgi:hypothetical protein
VRSESRFVQVDVSFLYIPPRAPEAVDPARLDVPAVPGGEGEGPNLGVFVFVV